MNAPTEGLRFAPIIRVSTEQQRRRGESLAVQTTQIRQYVELLHGTIPEHCWQYTGQESATPGHERRLMDKLLADSSKGLFDAVIVYDSSRWSRDNVRGETGLNTLRDNGIRFFAGTTEYDLFNPNDIFLLTLSTVINQKQAREQALKSINSRLQRTRRGRPASGFLPYGRTYDKRTETWGIDPRKQALIVEAARRYLDGEGFKMIAPTLGFHASALHKILTQRSGTEWTVRLRNKDANIDETITMQVPELLPEATREAIVERARINNCVKKGRHRAEYLLSGFIFCRRCGLAMDSYSNSQGKRYYRHSKHRVKCFKHHAWATALENAVLVALVQTFGDPERIERAVAAATPDTEKRVKLTTEQTHLTAELRRVAVAKERLIDNVADGLFTKDEISGKMEKIRANEEAFRSRLQAVEAEMEGVPDMTAVRKASVFAAKVIEDATRNNPDLIFRRPFEWRRRLVERAFSGTNAAGERCGVYVDHAEGFTFEVRGVFEKMVYALPLTDEQLIDAFQLDHATQDVALELRVIREKLFLNTMANTTRIHVDAIVSYCSGD